MGNQRDLDDVDGRENYLLLLVTHPRYHSQKIPGAEETRCREFCYVAAGDASHRVDIDPIHHQGKQSLLLVRPPLVEYLLEFSNALKGLRIS